MTRQPLADFLTVLPDDSPLATDLLDEEVITADVQIDGKCNLNMLAEAKLVKEKKPQDNMAGIRNRAHYFR